jgi:hypothetical protein
MAPTLDRLTLRLRLTDLADLADRAEHFGEDLEGPLRAFPRRYMATFVGDDHPADATVVVEFDTPRLAGLVRSGHLELAFVEPDAE